MKKNILIGALILLIATLLILSTREKSANREIGVQSQMEHMQGGMNHSQMMVTNEKDFIEGMIPHHQEAIDTAKEVLERGNVTPGINELLENIVAAQTQEIESMKAWYQDWYGTPYQADASEYSHMMRSLEGLSGKEIDQTFLEDMIFHHMGAIMMARSVAPYAEHEEIKNLTQAIIQTQAKEIDQMQQMLQGM
ncbi:MAG: DUF305 domain-containing protein [Candidatus Paceibacterota bacterium]